MRTTRRVAKAAAITGMLVTGLFTTGCQKDQPTCEGLDTLSTEIRGIRRSLRQARRSVDDLRSMATEESPKVWRVNTSAQDEALKDAVFDYLEDSDGDKRGVFSDNEVVRALTRRQDAVKAFEAAREAAAGEIEGNLAIRQDSLEGAALAIDQQGDVCGDADLSQAWDLVDEADDLPGGDYRWLQAATAESGIDLIQRFVEEWEDAQDEDQDPSADPSTLTGTGDFGGGDSGGGGGSDTGCDPVGLLHGRRVEINEQVVFVTLQDYEVCDSHIRDEDGTAIGVVQIVDGVRVAFDFEGQPLDPQPEIPDCSFADGIRTDAVEGSVDPLFAELQRILTEDPAAYGIQAHEITTMSRTVIEESYEAHLEICASAVGDEDALQQLRQDLKTLLGIPADHENGADGDPDKDPDADE